MTLLAYPVVLAQLSVTTMGVVDSAMVGQLGPVELAAVGFGGNWMWTIFCFFVGAAGAVQTFVAQKNGAREPEACGFWSWQGAWFTLPFTMLAALALYFGLGDLHQWVLPSDTMRPLTQTYMSIRLLGEVAMVSGYVFSSFFRGIGDTRTPLYATLVANFVNFLLDYALIFGKFGFPEWGIAGAATATVLSEWIFAALMLVLFLRPKIRHRYRTKPVAPSWKEQKRIIRMGFPIGGIWATEMLFFAIFLTLVARLGDHAMAASQAFIALLSLSFMQASGVGVAVATLVGRYIGANRSKHVRTSFFSGQKLAFLISLIIGALFLLLPEQLMRIFTKNPEVIEMGTGLLLLGALYQFVDAVCIVTDNALRGAGDTQIPFIARLVLSCVVLVPLAWYMGFYLDGGLTGLWVASCIDLMILAIFLLWRFQSGAWRKIQI